MSDTEKLAAWERGWEDCFDGDDDFEDLLVKEGMCPWCNRPLVKNVDEDGGEWLDCPQPGKDCEWDGSDSESTNRERWISVAIKQEMERRADGNI